MAASRLFVGRGCDSKARVDWTICVTVHMIMDVLVGLTSGERLIDVCWSASDFDPYDLIACFLNFHALASPGDGMGKYCRQKQSIAHLHLSRQWRRGEVSARRSSLRNAGRPRRWQCGENSLEGHR